MGLLQRKENNNLREIKKSRLGVLVFLGVTLFAVFGVIFYRERKLIYGKIFAPKMILRTIVSGPTLTPFPRLSPAAVFLKEIGEINKLIEGLRGDYGIYVQDLKTKEAYGVNLDRVFSSASLNKLPVLLTLYLEAEAGRLNLETRYILKSADKKTGAGSMQYKPAGTVYTYRKMAELMGRESDNTAFAVFSKLFGPDKIQKTINDLGMKKTSFKDFETSPSDLGVFFSKLYDGKLLLKVNQEEVLSFLTNSWWEDRIPTGVPEDIKVSHKVGTEIGIIADAGIVFAKKPYVLVILSERVIESEAKEVLPRISELVYRQRSL